MTARHPQDDLPGLVLGELAPATAAAAGHHLTGCDPCRRDLAAVAFASSALRDAASLEFPAPELALRDVASLDLPASAPRACGAPGTTRS